MGRQGISIWLFIIILLSLEGCSDDTACSETMQTTSKIALYGSELKECEKDATGSAPVFTSEVQNSLAENNRGAMTVTAADADGQTLTYSITGGEDRALFSIDSSSGALTFNTAPDFESPTDANADNRYIVEITVTDGVFETSQIITIVVTDADENAPVFTSSTAGATVENNGVIMTVTASDPDASAISFSITGGTDQSLFTIDSVTGELRFINPPDFDEPLDSDANNQYIVQVTINDGTHTTNQTITVTVTDINDTAPVFTSSSNVSVSENTTAVMTVTASDVEGDTPVFSIVGGDDQAHFSINSTTGVLTFGAAKNYESPTDSNTNNSYLVSVQTSDGTNTRSQLITVTVTDVNEFTPVFTSSTTPSMVENTTAAITVTATDGDGADTVRYSIIGGVDQARFSINSSSGVLSFITAPNFESPTDADTNNTYIVQVQASDNTNTANQTITVSVTDANDNSPVFSSSNTTSINENTTAVITVTTTDADSGSSVSYSIVGGVDQAKFSINSGTGALSFSAAPDYETPTDSDTNNSYVVQVQANDGVYTSLQTITVTVNNTNDNTPVITSSSSAGVAENTSTATTVTATDADGGSLTYSITGGVDAADFNINSSTGELTFASNPNFEAPADSDTNNEYVVQVQVSDGTNTANQTITITVSNDNEFSPVITSSSSASVAENTSTVLTVTSTDADSSETMVYSISGGVDQSLFSINSSTGELSFTSGRDYETPTDSNTDNSYVVQVRVYDGMHNVDQTITVSVTDANDNTPTFTSSTTASVEENSTSAMTVTVSDPDTVGTISYSLIGGVDQTDFNINSSTGALTFAVAPNYEAPADADTNNTYIVQVQVSDGANTASQTITITVTDVTDESAPVITSSSSASVVENTTTVQTVTATGTNTPFTYSLNGGADQARFSINSTTGALSFASAPDFESPNDADTNNIYIVEVKVTDTAVLSTLQTVTVTVTNANDNSPVFSSSNSASVPENTLSIMTVSASDADSGSTIGYSIVGGVDQAKFNINGSSGALSFASAPDFESPTDSDTNNSYIVQVRASDGTNTTDQTITVTVTNTNDNDPVFTSATSKSVVENNTAVMTVAATDADAGSTITYGISGGLDQSKFSINSSTGALVFTSAPDYESPTDTDTNNTYLVQVSANDTMHTVYQTVTVTVTNANDNSPVFSSSTTASVVENNTAVMTVVASDADVADTITYSTIGGADQAKFSINSSTGALSFSAAPNFEVPTDSDTNNTYIVQVQADDGAGATTNQTITVTVTNANDNSPVFSSSSTPSMPENNTAAVTVTATDADASDTVSYSIIGGVDQAKFSINSSSGALSFNTAPDFESPTDSDTNNTYIVQVRASDGTNTTDQTITVTVTNVAEDLTVSFGINMLKFSWSNTGSDHYKIFEDPTGGSGYSQLGSNLTVTNYDHAINVHSQDWGNAKYISQSCDIVDSCTDSNELFPSLTDALSTIGYFKASNTGNSDGFGYSVALSEDGLTMVVGAKFEDSSTTGINSTPNDSAADAGAVYVFISNGDGTWSQQAYIKASSVTAGDYLGHAVALDASGDVLAVGAPGYSSSMGQVFVFTRSAGTWSQKANFSSLVGVGSGSGDQFGYAVALSDTGTTLAVGAIGEDSGFDGVKTTAVFSGDNGSADAGIVYIMTSSSPFTSWSEQARMKYHYDIGDNFGWAVDLSSDGNTLAAGVKFDDSSTTGINSTPNDLAADAGAVHIYSRSGTTWSWQAYIKASNTDSLDYFGQSIALSDSGDYLVVGASGEDSDGSAQSDNSAANAGAAYVYTRSGTTWSQQAYIKPTTIDAGDEFGYAIDISDDSNKMVIGAWKEDGDASGVNGDASSNAAANAGAAYFFSRSGTSWTQQTYIKPRNTSAGDEFGCAVRLDNTGAKLTIGASAEDSNTTGVSSTANDSGTDPGAVYLY